MTDDRLLAAKRKFSRLLKEIFQFDCADLDFGIYRILAMRRVELERFMDDELLPQVEGILASAAGDQAAVEAELSKLESTLRDAGIADFTSAPKWNELKARLASAPDVGALAREVFSDLTTFFGRYYDEGDFMALPRYKGDTYAIPYDGSEVKLHWANADQYYIKTTEQHADYTAVVDGAGSVDKLRLRFRLATAEADRDNNKSSEKRRYVLRGEEPVEVAESELTVWFHYRVPEPGSGRQPTQGALCEAAEQRIIEGLPTEWKAPLARPAAQNPSKYTALGYQLYRYTKKNTSDYFIHKDPGGFLRRELDFFIKNEVLFLDDIEGRSAAEIDAALQKVKAIRAVGGKIIDWLAQIEDFQKRLYLKRKFVMSATWLLTPDRVPESVLAKAVATTRQHDEWVALYALDRESDRSNLDLFGSSDPLREQLTRGASGLTINTEHLDRKTVSEVLEHLNEHVGRPDGLLVHGENFAALRLLARQNDRSVDAVYLDPPYNTGEDGFLYKDGYQSSTWATMMTDRLAAVVPFLSERSAVFVSIDDNSQCNLSIVGTRVFGDHRYRTTFVWQKKDTPANDSKGVSTTHEYVLMFPFGPEFRRGLIPRSEDLLALYKNPDNDQRGPWTRTSLVVKRFVSGNDFDLPTPNGASVRPPAGQGWSMSRERLQELIDDDRIWWGSSANGMPYRKKFLSEASEGVVPISWWDYSFAGSNRNSQAELRARFAGPPPFDTPKPIQLLSRVLGIAEPGVVLDFFAGSGTTAEAAIARCRTGAHCRHISVDVGDHFESALVPRIRKAIFSDEWKDGAPVRENGVSHVVKVVHLESYDDSLENIELARPDSAGLLESSLLREDYTLRYMLDLESEGSLLDLERFHKPWDYTIKVRRDGVVQDSPVDLVETFNYLIGLRVRRYDTFGQDGLLFVMGTDPDGRRVIVVWRDADLWPNDRLEEKCRQAFESFRPDEFDVVYVNGDNHLPIIRTGDETWKVNLIEETFHARMFDTSDLD